MELKHYPAGSIGQVAVVLIVPSGIETYRTHIGIKRVEVLIVPSGIETSWFFAL